MAIEIKKDTFVKVQRPIGIKFPLVSNEQSFFQQNYTTEDQRKDDFFSFFSTKYGERVMRPTYGTKIYQRLFEPNEQDTSIIENIIRAEADIYLPWAIIQSVEFYTDKTEEHLTEITIKWNLTNDPKILETNIVF